MKLSMWILADWLKGFSPSVRISSGQARLTGVRLYSSLPADSDPSVVVVGYASQILPRTFRTKKILCLNGEDRLLIDHTDINAVLNEILKAFEVYNEWESSIKDAAYADAAFETSCMTLIDLSFPIIKNPMLIADWKGQILAVSRDHKPIADKETWDYWLDRGYLPPYNYERIRQNPEFLANLIHGVEEIRVFYFPQFKYRCIHFSVRYKTETAIYMHIIEDDTQITQGLIQTASVLKRAIAIILERTNSSGNFNPIASLFADIVSGKEPADDVLSWVRTQLGWDKTKAWYLVAFHTLLPESFSETALLELLKKQIHKGCSLAWENHPIMILDCEEWTAVTPKIRKILDESGFCCGVSMPFNKQSEVSFALNQAKLSIELARGANAIAMCADYAWSYLVKELKSQILDMNMIHPAVSILDEHDRRTGGQLSRTLYEYLCHERNAGETANALFLHRNSLRYRLDRINELIGVDLNNPDTRTHIMLSYQIKELMGS